MLLIQCNGIQFSAQQLNHLSSLQIANAKQCFLISNSYQRTIKYFQCLAAAIPCISHLWIRDSSNEVCSQNVVSSIKAMLKEVVFYQVKTVKNYYMNNMNVNSSSSTIGEIKVDSFQVVVLGVSRST